MLLDSNIVIYGAKPAGVQLRAWLRRQAGIEASVVTRVEALGYPELTVEEEERIAIIFHRVTMLPVNDRVIERAVTLRRQRRMKLGDALIAATALVHNLALAARNTDDFRWIAGLHLVDPLAS